MFKPLLAAASLMILYDMLPLDFQHWIAPSLVSYEQVYSAELLPPEVYAGCENAAGPVSACAQSESGTSL